MQDDFKTKHPFGIIYLITFPNNKVYVGKTHQSLSARIRQHNTSSKNIKYNHTVLYKAYVKYDISYKDFSIIHIANDTDNLNLLEIGYISKLNSYFKNPNSTGYNSTLGGDGIHIGHKLSKETRDKMSKRMLGNSITKGYKHSEEFKKNCSLRMSKQVHSEERKYKSSLMMKGNTHAKGRTISPENKAKLIKCSTGRVKSKEELSKISKANSKPIYADGFIFPSGVSAAKNLNLNPCTITKRLRTLPSLYFHI